MPREPLYSSVTVPIRSAVSVHSKVGGSVGVPLATYEDVPPLLLQAVVESTAKSADGDLILTLEPAWNAILKALAKDPELLRGLTPRQWEELVAASYDKAGFDEVILTPRSGDYGRDVIAVRKGWGSVRIIDQVKAFTPGRLVKADDVRALIGVLMTDRNATKGVVTTTSSFAPRIADDPSIAPHMPYRLELVNGEELFGRLKSLGQAKD